MKDKNGKELIVGDRLIPEKYIHVKGCLVTNIDNNVARLKWNIGEEEFNIDQKSLDTSKWIVKQSNNLTSKKV